MNRVSDRTSERRDEVGPPPELRSEGKTGSQFCEALRGVIEGRDGSEKMLVESIRTFAVSARARSLPPEATIVLLKHLFQHACSTPPHKDQLAERELLERIVGWCIQDYYGPERVGSAG